MVTYFYPYYKSIDFSYFSEKLVRRNDFNKPIDVLRLNDLPEEFIEVPLTMVHKETFEETQLSVKTGFLGMVQEKNGLIKPEIGWFISNMIDKGEAQKRKRELSDDFDY